MNERKTNLVVIGVCSAFIAVAGVAGAQPLGSEFDHNTGLIEYMDSDVIESVEARDSSVRDLIARHSDRAGLRLISAPIKMLLD